MVSGVGVPQLTAVMDACSVASKAGVPVIADGGIRWSGDITKVLAAGAHTVMIGIALRGLGGVSGELVTWKGKAVQGVSRMGSLGAMVKGSADRYGQKAGAPSSKLVPEGIEGRVPFRGSLSDCVYQLVGGVRSGMGYCGTASIEELRTQAEFYRVTGAGMIESHPHDVAVTKESTELRTGGA